MEGFDVIAGSVKVVPEVRGDPDRWVQVFLREVRDARAALSREPSPAEAEELVRAVFNRVRERARADGVELPEGALYEGLIEAQFPGIAPLIRLAAEPGVEDIALNLRHVYVYRTGVGWEARGRADPALAEGIRTVLARHVPRPPGPDFPIVDARLRLKIPLPDGRTETARLRVLFVAPPASPDGDLVVVRVARVGGRPDWRRLVASRLPPAGRRPTPMPQVADGGRGVLSGRAARYLIGVLARGGAVVVAGPTGSGKTTLAAALLQGALDLYPPGALRLFVIEDTPEVVLNGWSGDPEDDTLNVVYTLTRPAYPGGPPPITAYDLIRAALRARPDGIVVGEARGPEAWEFVRAVNTGHGHSIFTMHAASPEAVWDRFAQMVRTHPDVERLPPRAVAYEFAQAVTAVAFITRDETHGQAVRSVAEVDPVVSADRPAFTELFAFDPAQGRLVETGRRPRRPGFTFEELEI